MDPEAVTLSVSPVLGLGDEINEIRSKTAELVSMLIIPNENRLRTDISNSQSLRQEIITNVKADISAIKVFVPAAMERVVDRAIQVYGAKGVSSDTPLESMYRGARTLRILDGPDEVHRIVIAKQILKRYKDGMSWDFGT